LVFLAFPINKMNNISLLKRHFKREKGRGVML